MVDFDSDYLRLPLVPFVVELPDRCFLVKVSLCRAAQEEFLPHFDLIEVIIQNPKNKSEHVVKPIGHRAREFLATCSAFILIADDGYRLKFEPLNDWYFERWEAEEYPCFSLDAEPADDIEAYDIYQQYIDKKYSDIFKRIIELLNTNKISIDYLKNKNEENETKPTLYGYIDYFINAKVLFSGFDKNEFTKAIANAALSDKPVRKRNRVKVKDIDLLVSYHFILNNQPGISQQQAREKAIKLKFPNISEDDLARRNEALKKLIKDHEHDTEINSLFPDNQLDN